MLLFGIQNNKLNETLEEKRSMRNVMEKAQFLFLNLSRHFKLPQ